ncbi:hypothetical protein, partial [Micromonospora sp. CB01531]|uniref:hypothetical protein n=1 Tax=Micromonospora sp. CB01531 TaxID=1718947 RepID=UPI000A7DEA48
SVDLYHELSKGPVGGERDPVGVAGFPDEDFDGGDVELSQVDTRTQFGVDSGVENFPAEVPSSGELDEWAGAPLVDVEGVGLFRLIDVPPDRYRELSRGPVEGEWPDPRSATTREEFCKLINTAAGRRSNAAIAAASRAGGQRGITEKPVAKIRAGKSWPANDYAVRAFLRGCEVPEDQHQLWVDRYRELSKGPVGGERPDPRSASTRKEFHQYLNTVAGHRSNVAIEAASRAGGQPGITDKTAANMRGGKFWFGEDTLRAFLRGCDVPEDQHQPWVDRYRELSKGPVGGERPDPRSATTREGVPSASQYVGGAQVACGDRGRQQCRRAARHHRHRQWQTSAAAQILAWRGFLAGLFCGVVTCQRISINRGWTGTAN